MHGDVLNRALLNQTIISEVGHDTLIIVQGNKLQVDVQDHFVERIYITKTCPCNIQMFSVVNIENFIGIFSLYSLDFCSEHRLWVHVRRGGSNEYPEFMFWRKNKKK